MPQPVASIGAIAMAATQAWLVLSGNFSWLNLVTIILTVSAIDDGTFKINPEVIADKLIGNAKDLLTKSVS